MKILMVCSSFGIGGAETHILELSLELSKVGHAVFVASLGGEYAQQLKEKGIVHYTVNLMSKNPAVLANSYRRLKSIIKKEKIDIIHSHARLPSFLCNAVSKRTNIPFVTTAHWVFENNLYKKHFTRWGEHTLAVSEDIKCYLKKIYGVEDKNITVTRNGIDTDKFSSTVSKSKNKIVCVSRIDKGRSEAAFALTRVAPIIYKSCADVEIVIIGGGDLEAKLKEKVDDANKNCKKTVVKFLGRKTNIEHHLKDCGIFVGVSRAALEALSCGCCVVLAGDEGYSGIMTKEVLKNEMRTNFCCRGSERMTAEKLSRDLITLLFYSSEQRRVMQEDNRKFVKENYSVYKMAHDALTVYKKTIRGRKKHAKRVLICGYYGYGNMGDEIILKSVVDFLKRNDVVNITVMSASPKKTKAEVNASSFYRYNIFKLLYCLAKSNYFLLGGGNLLQNQTSSRSLLYYGLMIKLSKMFSLKCIMISSGVGELKGKWAKRFADKVMSFCDLICLRTASDVNYQKSKNLLCQSSLDFGFLYDIAPKKDKNAKYFLVAAREPKFSRKNFVETLSKTINKISAELRVTPCFVAMHPKMDKKIVSDLAKRCVNSEVYTGASTDEFLSLLKNSAFSIGMRLHSTVMSVKCNIPHICIPYDEKCKNMVTHIIDIARCEEVNVDGFITLSSIDALYDNSIKAAYSFLEETEHKKLIKSITKDIDNLKLYLEKI